MTWTRARFTLTCGSCRAIILVGAPLLELEIGASRRARCQACALRIFNESPPADLLELMPPPAPREPRKADFVTLGQLAKPYAADFRRRQSGDAE